MSTFWPHSERLRLVTPHQRAQYAIATTGALGIFGGNPGVGKTFTVAQIISSVIDQGDGDSQIAAAAPTGKAAQRLNELLIEHGISNLTATTIHRLLGVRRAGYDGKGWGFVYGKELPLPQRYIFIDEASMLGTNLLASLLAALRPGHHLLLIGDFAQLPPVDHGAPLRDLIAAGIPYGELTEPMRHEGDIVVACRDVKEGRPVRPSSRIDVDEGHNLLHIEASTPNVVLHKLTRLLQHCPSDLDPIWDVQVVCAVNESGELSRKALNVVIQSILNPNGTAVEGMVFRLNDKVICGTNQMLPEVTCIHCNYGAEHVLWDGRVYRCDECDRQIPVSELHPDFVANGEIGRVTLIEKNLIHVDFDSPRRTIRVAGNALNGWNLAYAITCHRGQGSQWPIVCVVVDSNRGADMVTSFEWHRTAWSRAQRLCVTIGKLSTIHKQCRKSALKNRKTFLTELV